MQSIYFVRSCLRPSEARSELRFGLAFFGPLGYGTKYEGIFLRATAECFARFCHRLGVHPSVCLSVCLSHL